MCQKRPYCFNHSEISFLDQFLLYLTGDCEHIFHKLIKCDYWRESEQIKAIKNFEPLDVDGLQASDSLGRTMIQVDRSVAQMMRKLSEDLESPIQSLATQSFLPLNSFLEHE